MQKYDFWGDQVELDKKATLDWYANADEWDCECGHCRNFLELAKKKELPVSVIETLAELGIPLEKATYICELYTDEEGVHYQFSYRIAGTILTTSEQENARDLSKGRCCHEPYPYGAPNFPEPHFDLEFGAILPWVLEESPNG